MRLFGPSVAGNGRDHHLESDVRGGNLMDRIGARVHKDRDQLVELEHTAGPTVDQQKGHNTTVGGRVGGPGMDEVDLTREDEANLINSSGMKARLVSGGIDKIDPWRR